MEKDNLFEKTEILTPIHEDKIDLEENNFIKKEKEEVVFYYDEEFLLDTLGKDFSDTIKNRGEDYYDDGNVLEVYKNNNTYIAKVDGNSMEPYDVKITIKDEEHATYECSCPCSFPCKHEYAVLMAVSNFDYLEVELKEFIKENKLEIKNIIQEIPGEEIKKYMLNQKGLENIIINQDNFYDYFLKYLPKQSYEFYYNNLYNDMVTNNNYRTRIENYIMRSRKYLECNEFNEVFKIIKAIIEVYNDTNEVNNDNYVFEVVSRASMLLRIAYRKSNEEDKNNLNEWINKLVEKNYYNNYYLEDLILNIK